ncbi:MAG: class I SAM-dependent methyltransferase [Burkholderiaceae bacterium]|nr:class I SAM-dependent methyltransferase [Burkholderiaceae bacterium]
MRTPLTPKAASLNLLHIGCGTAGPERLPPCFRDPQWMEIRADIDPSLNPDIVCSMLDLSDIESASFDAIWSSHNLEHLSWYEVPTALAEFHRVLKPDGFALITVPDLRAISGYITNDKLTETLYDSPAGPISPLDILFGHQRSLQQGNPFMAHKTGFTANTLGQALIDAGFDEVRVHEGERWDLWALACMPQTSTDIFRQVPGLLR